MPGPTKPFTDLLAELAAAVRAGDRARVLALEREILQRLASEAADRARIEREVRALLAGLDRPPSEPRIFRLEDFDLLERSGPAGEAEGEVYPVWFGTHRKPQGEGFGSERHGRTSLGRALVYVPEAHRFGETGSSLWRKLLRFDLRQDLRIDESLPVMIVNFLPLPPHHDQRTKTSPDGSLHVANVHWVFDERTALCHL